MRTYQKHNGGYSLVEAVMYAALFAVLSVLLINSLLLMMHSYTQTRVNRDILDSAHTSIERMSREIRAADSIDPAQIVVNTTPGVLVLNSTVSGVSKVFKFSLVGGSLQLTEDGVVSGNLTGSQVVVTRLIFNKITTPQGVAIRVQMTLQATRGSITKTMDFYDTVALRGSY